MAHGPIGHSLAGPQHCVTAIWVPVRARCPGSGQTAGSEHEPSKPGKVLAQHMPVKSRAVAKRRTSRATAATSSLRRYSFPGQDVVLALNQTTLVVSRRHVPEGDIPLCFAEERNA